MRLWSEIASSRYALLATTMETSSRGDADGSVAIVDHHGRVEILDFRRVTVLALDQLLPLGGVDAFGVGARLPHVDPACAAAVLAEPVVLAQQSGHPLIARRRRLEGCGDLVEAGRTRQAKCHDGDDHRGSP